ncbi:threonylcarbamoyl-AMP synthase [bacterium]|nr:threonylcarbamoyl-AMP synthase [bacterium]
MEDLKNTLNENSTVVKLNNILKEGGVIAFVTDTVWGIGCLPYSEKGVNRIYEIKGRDREKPLILMSDKEENLMPYVKDVPDKAKELMSEFFPGALTLVVKKSEKTPAFITSNKDTVGIRVPDNTFFKELCSKIEGHVLATTSANLSNHPSSKTYEDAINSIGNLVDIVFQDDETSKCAGRESTVALVTDNNITILRQGSVNITDKNQY